MTGRPHPGVPVIDFLAYVDTLIIFLPVRTIRTVEKNRLRDAYGAMPRTKVNTKLGYTMIATHCPQKNCLSVLDELQAHYGGVVSRIDFAFEACFDPLMSSEEQMRWLKAHLLFKRRIAQPVLEVQNTSEQCDSGVFFIPHAHTNGSPRDCCLYGDRSSKLTPTIKRVARFELRLRTKEAFGTPYRNNKQDFVPIATAHDVITCDPSEVLKRHMRFVQFDIEKFRRKLFADKCKGRSNEEARRIIDHHKRQWNEREYQFDYVQRIHDRFPRLPMITNYDLVQLPSQLTWGAQRRSQSIRTKNIE
jgi:hypothetical protein